MKEFEMSIKKSQKLLDFLIENTKFFFPLIHLYYKIKENKEV